MLKGYLKIIRPANSVAAGLAVLLGVIIATGTIPPASLPLIAVVFLVTAAGNVINDYCDSEIDAINRPERPIPSGAVTKKGALVYSVILFAAGIAICLLPFINPLCLAFAIINSAILVLYAKTFKGMPLIGNICVSYLPCRKHIPLRRRLRRHRRTHAEHGHSRNHVLCHALARTLERRRGHGRSIMK